MLTITRTKKLKEPAAIVKPFTNSNATASLEEGTACTPNYQTHALEHPLHPHPPDRRFFKNNFGVSALYYTILVLNLKKESVYGDMHSAIVKSE